MKGFWVLLVDFSWFFLFGFSWGVFFWGEGDVVWFFFVVGPVP